MRPMLYRCHRIFGFPGFWHPRTIYPRISGSPMLIILRIFGIPMGYIHSTSIDDLLDRAKGLGLGLGGAKYPRIFGVGIPNILGCQIICDTGIEVVATCLCRGLKVPTGWRKHQLIDR